MAENKRCPLEQSYGGIRSGGGYGAHTQLNLNAQIICEAVHCILGSINKAWVAGFGSFQVEIGHLREEMGIVERFYDDGQSDDIIIGEHFSSGEEYQKGAIKNCVHNSPRLFSNADKMQTLLSKCHSPASREFNELAISCAYWCYETLMNLAAAIQLATSRYVMDYPIATKKLKNPYKDREFGRSVKALRVVVDNIIEWKEEVTINPTEGETEKGIVRIDTVPGYQKGRRGRARKWQEGHARTYKDRTIRNIVTLDGGFLDRFEVGLVRINNIWLVVMRLPLNMTMNRHWIPVPWSYIDTVNNKLREYDYGWDVKVGGESSVVSTVKKKKRRWR